jgi:spore coat protein U-like protein
MRAAALKGWLLAVAVLVWLLPGAADAARSCRLSVTDLNFGTYTPGTGSNLDVAGEISVRCVGNPSPGQPNSYTLRIDGGQTGNPGDRRLQNGLIQLAYNLFQDAARVLIWGDGTAGTSPVFQAITNQIFRMQHRVYAGQYPETGDYGDAPMVTLEF